MKTNSSILGMAVAAVICVSQIASAQANSNYPCNDMRAIRDVIGQKQAELLDYKTDMVLQTSRANQIKNNIEFPDLPTASKNQVTTSIDDLLDSRSNINKVYNKLTILKNGINTDLNAHCGGA